MDTKHEAPCWQSFVLVDYVIQAYELPRDIVINNYCPNWTSNQRLAHATASSLPADCRSMAYRPM
jgi:hypothetical protein